MTSHFEVTFNDLDSSKKDDLIEEMAKQLQEEWKEYVEKRKNIYGKGRTWQDIFCEIEGIDEELRESDWSNWEFSVEGFAEEKAEEALYKAFKHLEVEVEV